MKQVFTAVFCCLAIALTAQPINSDQINYIISIENEISEPLQNQEVIAVNPNEKEDVHKQFTTSKGKVKFILKRGETYQFTYLNEHFEEKIPTSGQSFLTKKIIYKGKLNVGIPIISDTITFLKSPQKPTATEALFQLIIKNKEGEFLKGLKIWLVQSDIKKTYQATTNTKGEATFLLPIGYDYTVNFEKDANYKTIIVPKMEFLSQRKGFIYTSNFMQITETERNDTVFQNVPFEQLPTLNRALIEVTVLDLDGQPLSGENVYLQGIHKVYTATTNVDGKTALMLPKNGYYAVNFDFRDSLEVLHFEAGNYTRKDNIRYKYIGSKAIKQRILERAQYEALWDSLSKIQAFRDSLAFSRSPFSNFAYKLEIKEKQSTFQLIEQRAAADWKELQKNPKYFEAVGDEVAAAFYRNRKKWDDKIIVTDLTCSMYPYLDQILSWHVLEGNQRKEEAYENQYIFFNDGDGKSMAQKIIGQTGGFHYTDALTLDALTQTMIETMSTGCSIDGPENDLEALLDAVKNRKLKGMEIILIADNNSDIRDFELLSQLNVPIRVILAGTFWGANEQYLELAYKTKGSVHTIEQDLERLFELNDGDYIKIGTFQYRVYKGQFLKMTGM